ncbi:LysR family transcriptional regulator [Paraglaciecola sp. L3A3]|uniref:LysR family transcriptional regulator n=1 Tax=Paraglaciecola sp. L3A3 TaxID=2686358 RepID=UPI00131ABE7A|nr:LysR family transcriptional regulator [Paraglaciecola sp. L3A3]
MRHLQDYYFFKTIAETGSIRKAAKSLTITSTALNRRILALEKELGTEVFERLPKGVELSAAGEVFLHHVREQLTDIEKVKSQIADLRGERRGHISIACSQALLPFFLPNQINQYSNLHPHVTFNVQRRDRKAAEQELINMNADIAVVFEPVLLADFHILSVSKQPTYAIVSKDHELAGKDIIKLSECLEYPLALPTKEYGLRRILDKKADRAFYKLKPAIESDSFEFLRYKASLGKYITFQIEVGLPEDLSFMNMTAIKVDENDLPPGEVYVGQLKGRTLPVAAAKFAQQLVTTLESG